MNRGSLPHTLPLFPLTGVLLLPRAQLPLNVFEPRYLAMTEAALASGRLVGMIQPLDGKGDAGDPPLCKTGCAGRIVEFRETEDGRFLITLLGVSRFSVARELPKAGLFRQAAPDWSRYAEDLEESEPRGLDRARLIKALTPFLARNNVKADTDSLRSIPSARLVDAVAMMAPFAPREKQALLEADPQDRAMLLTQLMEMSLLAESAPAPGGSPGASH
jgi:Lon protease-like protein